MRTLLATAVGLILCSASGRAETVTGTFRYADSNNVMRPIAFAKVEIWAFAPRAFFLWAWGREATVAADNNGSISVSLPHVADNVVYGVRVFATNYAAQVWPNDAVHTLPFYREPGQPGPVVNLTATSNAAGLDFSFDFVDGFAPEHYNIAEVVRLGFDYVASRRDPTEKDPLPLANVQPTSLALVSWYDPALDIINIKSDTVFEDFAILHEYGHFVEKQISSFAWLPSTHYNCASTGLTGTVYNDPALAWMEGFSDYFAQAVNLTLPPGTLFGTKGVGTPSAALLETPACGSGPSPLPGATPDTMEIFVAATLWDLVDPQNEPHDTIANQDLAIIQILDKELDVFGKWPTLSDFYYAWVARGLNKQALDKILAKHGIPIPVAGSPSGPGTGQGDRGKCLQDCSLDRDDCMAQVSKRGGPKPAQCVAQWKQCENGCGP